MKIFSSNLSAEQHAFICDELDRTCTAARRCGKTVPEQEITLTAMNNNSIIIDEAPFQAYCERKRQEQSYKLCYCGKQVIIQGGGYAGVLYGIYALLRKSLGADWTGLTDGDILFHNNLIDVPDKITPIVPFRGMNGIYPELDREYIFTFLRYMARNQWNMLMFHVWRYEACQWRDGLLRFAALCAVEFNIGGHSMENFLPDTVFDEHPEFFGWRDGRRTLRGSVELPDVGVSIPDARIQPCFTNPTACEYIAEKIAAYIASRPEIKVFSLWPHDGANNWCRCPKCIKTTPYDQMLLLAQKVLDFSSRPIYIEVLAYCSLLTIPEKKVDLCHIYTIFCPYLRHYEHHFYDPGYPREMQRLGRSYPAPDPVNPDDDRDYGLLLADWLKYLKTNRGTLGVFAYYQLVFHDEHSPFDRSRYLRFPSPELVSDELRHFMKLGMQVYYDCSCPYPNHWPDARLYSFYSRLLFDPRVDATALVLQYNQTFHGSSATKAIDAITIELDKGNHRLDKKLFAALEAASYSLPEKQGKRLRLWGKYVFLGCESFLALQTHNFERVAEMEESIIKLFSKNRTLFNNCISIDYMMKYSRRVIASREKVKTNIVA